MRHLTLVAGARPNFIKVASLVHAIHKAKDKGVDIEYNLVHTGQHYDTNMSGNFFTQLNIPNPSVNLAAGSGSQAEQTATIMLGFEKYLLSNPTDLVVVVGDVNSTMACSIVAQKLHIKVAHVEAGIRSNDRSMPEEINRLVTDAISDYYFTTSSTASDNLLRSGVDKDCIFFVGNTMVDTLIEQRSLFQRPKLWQELNLVEKGYIVLTLHRPGNVDTVCALERALAEITKAARDVPVIFPVHPRTGKVLNQITTNYSNLYTTEPLSYLEFNYLVERAKAVITDSGGVTEETTVMNVPCITLRDSTERPETVTIGTNELVGIDPKVIKKYLDKIHSGTWKKSSIPEKWDGYAAVRIIEIIKNL
jgi:UDP-N-acetylglucosamine 2-epimerase (non-hydrolysing)